jgi:DNA-binding beta-propeller fold protein YncE
VDRHDTGYAPGVSSIRIAVAAVAFAALFLGINASGHGTSLPLKEVGRVALPGPSNRFDYTSIDPTTNRLYIAHMNASRLLTFDLTSRKVVRAITVAGVHGVIAVPALHRVFASATDDHQAVTIDAKGGRIVAHAPAGSYPDGLAYDPVERHVFVSDEAGGVETVLNASGARIATIALGGGAGNVQYDAGSRRVLVDVQTRDEVAVIDPRTNRLVRRIPVPCQSDHSLYVDTARRLAFVACDGDAKLLTLDLRTMKVTQTVDVGNDPDVLAFDSGNRRLYVAAESGDVAILAEHVRTLTKLAQWHLAAAAHTVAVDSRSHLVYFPLAAGSNGRPQLLIMKPE